MLDCIFLLMKKDLFKKIEIPKGVEAEINDNKIKIKGPEGENIREFKIGKLNLEKKENGIILESKKATKREKKTMNTLEAHIKNMIQGVQKKFEYQLKIASSHFPINVEIKGKEIIIKNFLGEKIPRKTKIPQNVDVEINRDIISIKSIDKESAGQAAANFESATKIRSRDRRVFQDGIFMINKAGKEI